MTGAQLPRQHNERHVFLNLQFVRYFSTLNLTLPGGTRFAVVSPLNSPFGLFCHSVHEGSEANFAASLNSHTAQFVRCRVGEFKLLA